MIKSKFSAVFLSVLFCFCLAFFAFAWAGMGQVTGTILKIDLSTRTIVLKYQDKSTQKVIFLKDAVFTRCAKPANLSNFVVGDIVVVVVSGSMADDPIFASALYDKNDAAKPDKPGYYPTGVSASGMPLTWGGATAPPNMTSLNIVQKMAAGGGDNSLKNYTTLPPAAPPPGISMPPVESRYEEAQNFKPLLQDVGGSTDILGMKSNGTVSGNQVVTAAPSPMGSPMIGQAVSSSPLSNSYNDNIGGLPIQYQAAAPVQNTGYLPVQYQQYTPPFTGSEDAITPNTSNLAGMEDAEENAEAASEGKYQPQYRMDIYGQIMKVDASTGTFYIMTHGDKQLLTVTTDKATSLSDYNDGKLLKVKDFAPGDVIQVAGIQQSEQVIEGKMIMRRKLHSVK